MIAIKPSLFKLCLFSQYQYDNRIPGKLLCIDRVEYMRNHVTPEIAQRSDKTACGSPAVYPERRPVADNLCIDVLVATKSQT